MQQLALAVSLVILALVSSLTAFDSSKPFESQLDQEGNYCCLPNVFSYNYSLTVVVASNSSLVVSDGSQFFHADYNVGKIKQSASFSIAGKVYSFTLWDFKVSDSITVEYRVPFEGACSCGKISVNSDKWTPTCKE